MKTIETINEKYANHPKVTQHIVPDMTQIGKEDISIAEGCVRAFLDKK